MSSRNDDRGTAALDEPSLVVEVILLRHNYSNNASSSQKDVGSRSSAFDKRAHSLQLVARCNTSCRNEEDEDTEGDKKVIALTPVFEFGSGAHAPRDALMWGSTLASVHFAHWWQHTQQAATSSSSSSSSLSSSSSTNGAQMEATFLPHSRFRRHFRHNRNSSNSSSSSNVGGKPSSPSSSIPEGSSSTAAAPVAAAQRPLHLWQAARVALAELTSLESFSSDLVASTLGAWDAITR